VTGGEPLAQRNSHELMQQLCDKGYRVSIETSGAIDISAIDSRVSIVMDLKTPDSGELDRNLWSNLQHLSADKDQLKFVVSSRRDFDWAAFKIDELALTEKVSSVFFSPDFEHVDPRDLAQWVIESKLAVRMQVQLHKYLWGDKPGV
jgi:7-carboxy-7-deazaguanine synthase